MTLREMIIQAKDDFADFHLVHDGGPRPLSKKSKAESTARQYLSGGPVCLLEMGPGTFGAILAAIGDREFSVTADGRKVLKDMGAIAVDDGAGWFRASG